MKTQLLTCLALALLLFSCGKEDATFDKLTTATTQEEALQKAPTSAEEARQTDRKFLDDILLTTATIVELPAGSVDGLAAAIAQAGENGVVLVKAGDHSESTTVTISQSVRILGEPGAVMTINPTPLALAGAVDVGLYVLNTSKVTIAGLDIHSNQTVGGTAILVESSPNVNVLNNTLRDFEISILLHDAHKARISGNTIIGPTGWLTGDFFPVYGIIAMNGVRVQVLNNDIANAFFGAWACDYDGLAMGNNFHGNYVGLILCKVPEQPVNLPSGAPLMSRYSGTRWLAKGNTATGNFDVGYLVIDGANSNLLVGNNASGNARVDYDLAGDSERFGFLTPSSFNNKVYVGPYQSVKDCGMNNTVNGGIQIDTNLDPCF